MAIRETSNPLTTFNIDEAARETLSFHWVQFLRRLCMPRYLHAPAAWPSQADSVKNEDENADKTAPQWNESVSRRPHQY